jgi:hypothetical protein
MRHQSWDTLTNLVSGLAHKYGGTVHDKETHKTWDWGQAITREMYGVNWMDDPEYKRVSQLVDTEPAPEEAIEIGKRWMNGNFPEWIERNRLKDDKPADAIGKEVT